MRILQSGAKWAESKEKHEIPGYTSFLRSHTLKIGKPSVWILRTAKR
jgi:hypothetical protein